MLRGKKSIPFCYQYNNIILNFKGLFFNIYNASGRYTLIHPKKTIALLND